MNDGVNGVALGVFIFFFLAVTVMGFLAARWRKTSAFAIRAARSRPGCAPRRMRCR